MSPESPEPLTVLLRTTEMLDDLGIRYHLGGSFASSIHGVPRQTRDIDLVVELDHATIEGLVNRLAGEFFVQADAARSAVRECSSFNAIHLDSGMKIDFFILGRGAFDLEEFRRSRPLVIQVDPEQRVLVKSAEDTVLRKLQWYRQGGEVSDRQWTDVLGIVRAIGPILDETYLRRWAGQLGVADLLERVLAQSNAVPGPDQPRIPDRAGGDEYVP